ncbi:abortive infection family protein [Arthrobacter sp. zg-Y1143]|uniref:abortive infection family protein n=1 Tax=Arthrobacter sp. zg-Y1143 TaxID=3049065 RepID=UPI0024C3CD67|nr:abortive infection family protein [Arthrobacter sp. zg-Y1143]MDK1329128.1 abortive infection family protein [Arthrobacter sp. zg-Y1143]
MRNKITDTTRRKIIDSYHLESIAWSGRLSEPDFIGRIFDLNEMRSDDPRFKNAYQDIQQHRVRNPYDWEDDYVFTDPRFNVRWGTDDIFIQFLEMTVHPLVRDAEQSSHIVGIYNNILHDNGFHLVADGESKGQPVYKVKSLSSFHGDIPTAIAHQPLLTDSGVLHEHLDRINKSIARDPASAISSSKELLESLFKLILDQEGVEYPHKDDVPDLYKKVGETLRINAASVEGSSKASQTIQKIFRTLTTTVQAIAELRNEIGTGHGRTTASIATETHARLALNSTVTIAEFLLDTLGQRKTQSQAYELI